MIRLDVKTSPKTTASFVITRAQRLLRQDDLPRASIPGFIIQGGDPTQTGAGGPGYTTVDQPPADTHYTFGVVAMAKTQTEAPGTSGSQFFIVTGADAGLPPDYAVLGTRRRGRPVVRRIGKLGDPTTEQATEVVELERATVTRHVSVAAVVLAAGAATRYGGAEAARAPAGRPRGAGRERRCPRSSWSKGPGPSNDVRTWFDEVDVRPLRRLGRRARAPRCAAGWLRSATT